VGGSPGLLIILYPLESCRNVSCRWHQLRQRLGLFDQRDGVTIFGRNGGNLVSSPNEIYLTKDRVAFDGLGIPPRHPRAGGTSAPCNSECVIDFLTQTVRKNEKPLGCASRSEGPSSSSVSHRRGQVEKVSKKRKTGLMAALIYTSDGTDGTRAPAQGEPGPGLFLPTSMAAWRGCNQLLVAIASVWG
jgi:hypothetical protein